jgi:hypothetical protein
MSIVLKSLSLLLLVFTPCAISAQSRNCLRVMTTEELIRNATMIARVKVIRSVSANYRGTFRQVATLQILDVIEGDYNLKQVSVLAQTNVRCADDNYLEGQQMLVFLAPEDSLFHTLNFQYGQFPIIGEVVRGWRDRSNRPIDKPYVEVRQEIQGYISGVLPQAPPVLPPPPAPQASQANRPPQSDLN